MSKPIVVKFDNTLPDIEVEKFLYPTSVEEGGNSNNEMSEIKITGTLTPLLKINNRVMPWSEIISLTLSCTSFLPTLSFTVVDSENKMTLLDTPGPDNIVMLEILPKFENIYKKIKLRFYITSISSDIANHTLSANCIYYCDKLNDCNIESFGKITTYKFYEEVAQRLKLGLCSNLEDSGDDRYIYMSNDTFLEKLEDEVQVGGNPECILDSWIDWWNNINIVDLHDLYSGDLDPNLTVWVSGMGVNTAQPGFEEEPYEVAATLTNNFKLSSHPLYTMTFDMNNKNRGNVQDGTDRAVDTFDILKEINKTTLLQDGSGVKENIYTKYYYRGEFNSNDNDGSYLVQPEVIDIYKQKIGNNTISVTIKQPCLGLMRGGKVNLEWYDNSKTNEKLYKEADDMESNIDIDADYDDSNIEDFSREGTMVLNRKISGQYLIVGTYIDYDRLENEGGPVVTFKQTFILSRKLESFNYTDAIQ